MSLDPEPCDAAQQSSSSAAASTPTPRPRCCSATASTLYALTFATASGTSRELEAARAVARALGVRAASRGRRVDLRGDRRLRADDATSPVPQDRTLDAADIPSTYVPARNTIFLSLALALGGSARRAATSCIGVNALDYSGYPDCRPEFSRRSSGWRRWPPRPASKGARFHVHAPLLHLTKAEIIRAGLALGLDYGLTHSCYDPAPDGRPCGRCDSCVLRARGFAEAGVADPLRVMHNAQCTMQKSKSEAPRSGGVRERGASLRQRAALCIVHRACIHLMTQRLYYTDAYLATFTPRR